jgi:hypothetical protein
MHSTQPERKKMTRMMMMEDKEEKIVRVFIWLRSLTLIHDLTRDLHLSSDTNAI